jgi:hypothetical protein
MCTGFCLLRMARRATRRAAPRAPVLMAAGRAAACGLAPLPAFCTAPAAACRGLVHPVTRTCCLQSITKGVKKASTLPPRPMPRDRDPGPPTNLWVACDTIAPPPPLWSRHRLPAPLSPRPADAPALAPVHFKVVRRAGWLPERQRACARPDKPRFERLCNPELSLLNLLHTRGLNLLHTRGGGGAGRGCRPDACGAEWAGVRGRAGRCSEPGLSSTPAHEHSKTGLPYTRRR